MVKTNYKHNIISAFILILLIKLINSNCITHSFPDLYYPNALTLENGYHLMITSTGIYSFYPKLTNISSFYIFTEEQKMSTNIYSLQNSVNQNTLSQFSNEEGGKNIVICFANNNLYFMNERGKVTYIKELSNINIEFTLSLVPYKYNNGDYYFIIGYNVADDQNKICLGLYYYKINTNNELSLESSSERYLFFNETQYHINRYSLSCQSMKLLNHGKVVTCFENILYYNIIIALNYNPENNFEFLFKCELSIDEENNPVFIKSAVNSERNKAFICLSSESPNKLYFYYYDINENKFVSISFQNDCKVKYYDFNTFYFKSSNEYILSCLSNTAYNVISIYRLNQDFSLINNDITDGQISFEDCLNFDFFSIIYLSKYNKYSAIINSNCGGGGGTNIRFFMLTNESCIRPENEIEDENDLIDLENQDNPKTAIPQTIVTGFLQTGIFSTIPKSFKTSFLNHKTTNLTLNPSDTFKCNIGKKYYDGKCICDNDNGYYTINYQSSEYKCYKKEDIPKNTYFNNITQAYEFCYKTCGTCNKGGNLIENNCLTCAFNYIKEPEKNSSNCVEGCNYFYYYNSLDQYSCTEDEQCPEEASLKINTKRKCINKCLKDDINIYQYNGECLSSCPSNTNPNEHYICQLNSVSVCSSSESQLNLEKVIAKENVQIIARNYAKEFYYTINHISKFISSNFTMILYKNSFCIDELKLNISKIGFDLCIQKLKQDNSIDQKKELIVAIIDIVTGINPITSFGFFHPDTGEKLDASKSCSDKSVMIYENLMSLLNNKLSIQLLEGQKINIFNLTDPFYTDKCFNFDSPNGKDATLQDRIKTFYPNVTLCDPGCKNKGINLTTMKAECECKFQDLLSKNIYENNLFWDNVLIKESLDNIVEIFVNLNLDILICYKDVFDFNYFKKNVGGFIIIGILLLYTIFIVYYIVNKNKLYKIFSLLIELYIKYIEKDNDDKNIPSPPLRKNNNTEKNENIIGETKINENIEDIENNNFNHFNIININFNTIKKNRENIINISKSSSTQDKLMKEEHIINHRYTNKTLNYYESDLIKYKINIKKLVDNSFEEMDYDDIVEFDKRTFCQYFCEKMQEDQMIINTFFISHYTKPKAIKIAIFIFNIDMYFLINGMFYNDSYISEVFNSTAEETFFSFIPRIFKRFVYSTIILKIIEFIIKFFFVEEIKIKKILLANKNDLLKLRLEMNNILRIIIKRIRIFIIINYIIILFSWYYLSCLNNVYPHINREWILSSILFFVIIQIIHLFLTFIEACIRFISIKCESEKFFKITLLLY